MLTSTSSRVQVFAMEAETQLLKIRQVRPDLDLEPIKAWANVQALASPEHDVLHYLGAASRSVMRGDVFPWLPGPAGK